MPPSHDNAGASGSSSKTANDSEPRRSLIILLEGGHQLRLRPGFTQADAGGVHPDEVRPLRFLPLPLSLRRRTRMCSASFSCCSSCTRRVTCSGCSGMAGAPLLVSLHPRSPPRYWLRYRSSLFNSSLALKGLVM